MAEGKGIMYAIFAVLVVAVLLQFGIIDAEKFKFSTTPSTPAEKQKVVEDTLCPVGSDTTNTMTVGPQKQKWAPTTSMSSVNARVFEVPRNPTTGVYESFKASNDLGSKSDSTDLTVAGRDKIGIIYGYLSSYGSRWTEITAPCTKFQSGTYDSARNELVSNSTSGITFRVRNEYTGLQQAFDGSQNETINSAGVGHFEVTLQTVEKEGISAGTDENGVVGNVIITVEVNESTYDVSQITFGQLTKITAPTFYDVTEKDSKVVAFVTAGGPDPNQDKIKYFDRNLGKLIVTAKSGENPVGGSQSVGLGNVKVCVFDEQWSVDTSSGQPVFGVEKLKDGVVEGTTAGSYGSEGDCKIFDVT